MENFKVWKIPTFNVTVCKAALKACCYTPVLFLQPKECQVKHVTAEQTPLHFFLHVESRQIYWNAQECRWSWANTALSCKWVKVKILLAFYCIHANTCFPVQTVILEILQNPSHTHTETSITSKSVSQMQHYHRSFICRRCECISAIYSSVLVQLIWWTKRRFLTYAANMICFVFREEHKEEKKKKLGINLMCNLYQTEPEVDLLNVPRLEDIQA